MIRILHIVTSMNRGGLETLLMNCFRCMDRDRIQFDFLVHRSSPGDYDREIETLGGRIHRLPRLNPLHPGYYLALNHFFRSHPEYRIVHCHLDCMSALPLSAARKHSVPVRIAHSHNTSQDRDWKYPLKRILMKQTPRFATHFFACSRASGNWMFPGHPVSLIKNGIDTQCFRFSPPLRSQVRRELSLEGSLVVGHTGRLVPQKNHAFLLEIFAELHRRNADAVLLLAGEGPLESSLRRRAESLGISHQVRTPVFLPEEFHGQRSLASYLVHGVEKRQARFSNHVTCTHLISIRIKIAENCCLDWGGYFVTLLSVLLCVCDTFHSQTQQKIETDVSLVGWTALILVASLPVFDCLKHSKKETTYASPRMIF